MIEFVSLQICRSMNGLMEAWRLEERILTCGPLLGKGLTSTSGWEDWRNHSYEIGIIKHRVHSIHTNNVIISSQKSPPYSKSASHQALTNSGEGWSIRRQTLGNFTKNSIVLCRTFPRFSWRKICWHGMLRGLGWWGCFNARKLTSSWGHWPYWQQGSRLTTLQTWWWSW